MKFRLSVQPKPTRQELKSIAPSLLSDPAFSPDPHSNPYFVLNGEPAWASSPPVGHPALKSKNRRQRSNFAHPISATDFDFDLIPPPNSPVASSVIAANTYFPFPTTQPSSTKPESHPFAPTEALHSPVATPTGVVANTSLVPPRQGKEGKKRRMPFLTRRKSSAQPAQPAAKQKLVPTQSARADNDVTQRPRPAPVPRNVSEQPTSVKSFEPRPAFPLRSATVSGASTPSARSGGKSSAPSQISNARTQDLDRIDELDETNPWGIALHHGGPYEAAVQALRSANYSMATGTGSSMLHDYPRQALHAHGNIYVPPQVPTGVSLNLSPGQILPRNFDISPQAQYPRRQATVGPSHRPPPSILVPGTPASRRQSQPLPLLSQGTGPLPNPHPSTLPSDPPLPKRHHQPEPESEPEPELERAEDVSVNIGMAMLQPSASASSTPSIYLHPETSDDGEFDPYDPIHLEREHPRTPSPLVISSAEQSRGPSPDSEPEPQRLIPQPTIFRNASEKLNPDTLRQQNSTSQDHNTPPPYHDVILDPQHLDPNVPQGKSSSSSRQPSPGPPSSASHGTSYSDELGKLQTRLPERSTNDFLHSPTVQWTTTREHQFVAQMPPAQSSRELVYNLGPPPVQDHDARSANQITLIPPARSSHEHIGSPSGPDHDPRNANQVAQPPTRSREHVQNLGTPLQDRDARSTHHTISTYTSSQIRNGPPPPHRRVPKHLIMPTPLNNNPNNGMVQMPARFPPQSLPSAQFGPTRVQVQVRAQPHAHYTQHTHNPQAPQLFAPVQPNPLAQEKPLTNSSKLRKKLSTKITPTPDTSIPTLPIVTTVSFAPPVIGFGQPPSAEKLIGRSKPEKIPKRVLSKRRTDF